MADIDREALLDRVYAAICTPSRHGSWLAEDAAKAVLPVVAKAITDEVRKLHAPNSHSTRESAAYDPFCVECELDRPEPRIPRPVAAYATRAAITHGCS